MLEALERELAGRARWSRPEGGYFLWLDLPEASTRPSCSTRASEAGVTFVPGRRLRRAAGASARLAFSFVSPDGDRRGRAARSAGAVGGGAGAGIAARAASPATIPSATLSRISQISETCAVRRRSGR